MSTILPPVPPIPLTPAPVAVAVFKLAHLPEAVADAEILMCDAERELHRPRRLNAFGPLLSVEDEGDRETALGMYAKADKTVSAYPARMGSHLRSLS